jgi:hypothetical protein
MGLIGLGFRWGLILQALAIIHFVRRRPGSFWLWVILIGGPLGALVYIVVEVVPDVALLRVSLNRYSRRRRIQELDAIIVDNPAVGNREELADLLLEEGKFARARELYDSIISPRTDALDPFYRRGLAALGLSDPNAAVTDLERVVRADPKYDFNRASGLLAHAYALAGQADKADAQFKAAIELSTLNETYYNYAAFLAAGQRTAEAREWAQKILANTLIIPRYLRRRERPWFRRANALLKRLPAR